MTTKGSYVHKPIVKFLGHPEMFFLLKILMVLDKMIHKVFRIHKTLFYKQNPLKKNSSILTTYTTTIIWL